MGAVKEPCYEVPVCPMKSASCAHLSGSPRSPVDVFSDSGAQESSYSSPQSLYIIKELELMSENRTAFLVDVYEPSFRH